MLRTIVLVLTLVAGLNGCAHRGATRVVCDGGLRPINPPLPTGSVTVISPATTPEVAEKQP
jgi:hypothetical protein